jgi:tRNA 5-methylaminomethyl-2-thiouridine biosynthesis bifunctional protein
MKPLPTAHVPLPQLELDATAQPFSKQFDDVYFSRAGGVAETQHVFMRGNDLPARFLKQPHFTIGEFGFGTGLNFLVAWREFLQLTKPDQHLHYIAVEKYPLTLEMLQPIHAAWIAEHAGYQSLLDALLANYPLRLPGWHRIHLDRCTLTLGFGDATELWGSIDAGVDAWFIDGFSPAKNPDMWQEETLNHIARLSAPCASFATFTAAGAVKRSLQAQGFTVQKIRGFGHKRDMLVGWRDGASLPAKKHSHVTVIGAGIAGASCARALSERGYRVTVLERSDITSGASGNPAAVLYPQLTKFYTSATAWHFTAYAFMLRQLARWKRQGLSFTSEQIGMLRLPRPEQRAEDFASLQIDASIMRYVTRDEASALAGADVVSDGYWFPHGTWLVPAELCATLLQHARIMLRSNCAVSAIQKTTSGWEIRTANGELLQTDLVVIATAHQTQHLLPDVVMPLGVSAGQISIVSKENLAQNLKCIISHRGYVIPQADTYLLGATYDRSDVSGTVTEKNHAQNMQHARDALPGWRDAAEPLQGRTSLRATTPDRLPYAGKVGEGLYVSIGHGSRGMISAPLAAEVIVSQIAGETIPLNRELRRAIHPLRRNSASAFVSAKPSAVNSGA